MKRREIDFRKTCPICGKEKNERLLICPACYKIFTEQAGKDLANGNEITPLTTWVIPRIEKRLRALQVLLENIEKQYKLLQTQVKDCAWKDLQESLKGKRVSREIFNEALKLKAKSLWKKAGGNRLFAQKAILNQQLVFLESLLEELRKKAEAIEKSKVARSQIIEGSNN